ncbi:MAG: hypothetical protein HC922_05725 [Leptolyngbyaceae cyanobacterium SM2_3_12]|nr:hypothetical protein [Leptolyngbyaceae cyanobacterium SM2_3_12]
MQKADIIHVQTELRVVNLPQAVDSLRQQQITLVSSRPNLTPETQWPTHLGCLMYDPSGHGVRLTGVEELPERQWLDSFHSSPRGRSVNSLLLPLAIPSMF